MNAPHWIELGASGEFPVRGARRVLVEATPIALFRTGDGALFALLDRCPHKGGPLSDGMVYGHKVTCPLHQWSFSLETGEASAPHAGCATRFPVMERDGRIMIDVGALLPARVD